MQSPTSALTGLFNAAGGLSYHRLALRHRQTLWLNYAQVLKAFLVHWAPAERELVLIGPSAGWLLPSEFLGKFQSVVAIEPDPLARWGLVRRFPQIPWRMVTDDYFTPSGQHLWRDNLARLFDDFPDQALFFSDFLGQLLGLHPAAVAEERDGQVHETPAFAAWKRALAGHLTHRSWASSHDRLVASAPPLRPPLSGGKVALDLDVELGSAELAARLWPPGTPVADPLTGGIAGLGPRQVALWQRQPGRWHAMELVSRRAGDHPA